MPTVTVRPYMTAGTTTGIVTGAATAHAALSDDSDASYIEFSSGKRATVRTAAPSIPSGGQVRSATVRCRAKSDGTGRKMSLYSAQIGMDDYFFVTGAFAEYSTGEYGSAPKVVEIRIDAPTIPASAENVLAAELYVDWIYATQPTVDVTAPSGTITDTTSPTATWEHTPGTDGGGQTSWELALFSSAQYAADGFDPATSTALGRVQGYGATSSYEFSGGLDNGDYRVYVRTAQTVATLHWSDWDYSAFTIELVQPAAPDLTATGDDENGRIALAVTAPSNTALFIDGANGSNATTPDHSSLDLTGDLTIVAYLDPAGWWTPGTKAIVSRVGATAADGGYGLYIDGADFYLVIATGSDLRQMRIPGNLLWPGSTLFNTWIAAEYDDTAKTWTLSASGDPPDTALGDIAWTVVSASAAHDGGSPAASSEALAIGSTPAGFGPFHGTITRVYVIDGDLDGTVVASPDFYGLAESATGVTDDQGRVWTFNGGAEIQTVSSVDALTVQRSDDTGTTWAEVRGVGRAALTGPTWSGYDYEAPLGATVQYRARAIHATVNGDITSEWSTTATTSWTSTSVWLKDPDRPDRNRTIDLAAPAPQPVRPARKTDHDVLGRSRPLTVADVRGSARAQMTIETYTLDELDALVELIDGAAVLLLQTPDAFGLGSLYVSTGDLTETNPADLVQPWRIWTLPYTVVDAPADPAEDT